MSESRPDLDTALKELVKAFLGNVAARLEQLPAEAPPVGSREHLLAVHNLFGEGFGMFGSSASYPPIVVAAHRALLQHEVSCFSEPFDVHHFLLEQFFLLTATRTPGTGEFAENLVTALKRPQAVLSFEFPFPPAVVLVPDGWKGFVGPLRLEIGTSFRLDEWSGPGTKRHAISGQVESWGWSPATAHVARTVSEFLGSCLALGLGRLQNDPQDFSLEREPTLEFKPVNPLGSVRPPYRMIDLAARFQFTGPMEPTELELATGSLERYQRAVTRLFSQDDENIVTVRNAARLFALAQLHDDPGARIADYFVVLEALLLDRAEKEAVGARLREAIAFRLGRSAEERTKWKRVVKKLYDVRSTYVHAGRLEKRQVNEPPPADVAQDLARRVLREEIFGLIQA